MKTHEIVNHPSFTALAPIDRLKVLYAADERYRKMHPRERWKFVNMIPSPPPENDDTPKE